MAVDSWLVYDLSGAPLIFSDLKEAQECAKAFSDEWREPVTLFKVVASALYKPMSGLRKYK